MAGFFSEVFLALLFIFAGLWVAIRITRADDRAADERERREDREREIAELKTEIRSLESRVKAQNTLIRTLNRELKKGDFPKWTVTKR